MRLGIFKFSSCSGCIVSLITAIARDPPLASRIELRSPLFDEEVSTEEFYDIVFVEGSVSRREDVELLKKLRGNAKYLIVIGTCGLYGGIQKLGLKEHKPISRVIRVDYVIPGCPVEPDRVYVIVNKVLHGGLDIELYDSLCSDCKLKGNTCLLVSRKTPCLGPITRAGCGALCPSSGRGCIGCFGVRPDITMEKIRDFIKVLIEKNVRITDYLKYIEMFS